MTGSGSSPIARALAQSAAARDVARLRAHEDALRYGWHLEYDGDVMVTAMLCSSTATPASSGPDVYVITLDCDSYDVWPPEVKFVNPVTRTYVVGQDRTALPNIQGAPGFQLHENFMQFNQTGRVDQLACFSFARGYYDSSHSPEPHERWQQGKHWLYTTVRYLHRVLQPPYYIGRRV